MVSPKGQGPWGLEPATVRERSEKAEKNDYFFTQLDTTRSFTILVSGPVTLAVGRVAVGRRRSRVRPLDSLTARALDAGCVGVIAGTITPFRNELRAHGFNSIASLVSAVNSPRRFFISALVSSSFPSCRL